ncbi:MAG: hypothetical protein EXS14_09715 [Planctomycetes bacterium]|nr:hypothetical protein [Planctomycetota bacterium]
MSVIRALATGQDAGLGGPLRVELPADLLHPEPDGSVAGLLASAAFLAPDLGPLPSRFTNAVERTAKRHDLWIDLQTALPSEAAHLPATLLSRTVRLRLQVQASLVQDDHARSVVLALAQATTGRCVLVAELSSAERHLADKLIEFCASLAVPVDLQLKAAEPAAAFSLRAARTHLADVARLQHVNVTLPDGTHLAHGAPLDALAPWNILNECLRAAFVTHPGLCPFPFVMVRASAHGAFGACPKPDGPQLPRGSGAFHGDIARALRRSLLTGTTPGACVGCKLLPQVHAALEIQPFLGKQAPERDASIEV